jgi:hypothetical protein
MSQADTPVIKPYAGQLQDRDEKGSLSAFCHCRFPAESSFSNNAPAQH